MRQARDDDVTGTAVYRQCMTWLPHSFIKLVDKGCGARFTMRGWVWGGTCKKVGGTADRDIEQCKLIGNAETAENTWQERMYMAQEAGQILDMKL